MAIMMQNTAKACKNPHCYGRPQATKPPLKTRNAGNQHGHFVNINESVKNCKTSYTNKCEENRKNSLRFTCKVKNYFL